jgi:SPP1 gp7 family putative phage head morphogenesis protein
MTLESAIADELRPVIRRNIANGRRALADVQRLLLQPVRKASSRPFLGHIEAAETHYHVQLLAGLRLGLDPEQVARSWSSKAKPVAKDSQDDRLAAAARTYAKGLATDPSALQAALEAMYGAGYLIGAKESLTLLRNAGKEVSLSDLAVKADDLDWSQWTPGNGSAAAELAGLDGGRGLRSLLDTAGVTVQSIQDTRLDELASVLADGAKKGDSVDTIAANVRGLLDNPSRAEMVANTELNRAVTASTLDTYKQNGIEQFDVLIFNPCPVCEDQEAANPHDLGEDAPPYHPTCRCAAAPHLPEGVSE